MENLKKTIDISIDMINGRSIEEKNYTPIILFSNENGTAKQEIFNFKDKKVLCPAASGDQLINAIFYDAKDITTYDINILSKYITNLKIAAIKSLNYEEFLLFLLPEIFQKENIYFLSEILFNKVKPYLNEEDAIYWTQIISYGKVNGYGKFIDYGYEGYNLEEIKYEAPYYLDSLNYNILKEKLLKNSNYEFIHTNINNFKINSKYDLIDLSNIISTLIINDYYNEQNDFTLEELNNHYIDSIEQNIVPLINKEGDILVNYELYLEDNDFNSLLYSNKYESHIIPSKKKEYTDKVLRY